MITRALIMKPPLISIQEITTLHLMQIREINTPYLMSMPLRELYSDDNSYSNSNYHQEKGYGGPFYNAPYHKHNAYLTEQYSNYDSLSLYGTALIPPIKLT
eukprot:TRINITY_DN3766_c0_g1_i7.p1 TRINITY_DN3766_c0_g1~~TRINITY_DN3766_c0_g1_i7.p1  ORF type:complete len:101 (-),score=10.22 TRINITY_DN3766_c0_g1_i7:111-413(-)